MRRALCILLLAVLVVAMAGCTSKPTYVPPTHNLTMMTPPDSGVGYDGVVDVYLTRSGVLGTDGPVDAVAILNANNLNEAYYYADYTNDNVGKQDYNKHQYGSFKVHNTLTADGKYVTKKYVAYAYYHDIGECISDPFGVAAGESVVIHVSARDRWVESTPLDLNPGNLTRNIGDSIGGGLNSTTDKFNKGSKSFLDGIVDKITHIRI